MGRVTAPDLLGDVLPAHAPRRRAGTATIAAIGVSAALVMGTGAFAAASLSGGGPQPEDVLPAGAIAFAKLDLDPSAEQKQRVFGLTKRFPSAAKEIRSADSLREDLLRVALEDSGLDYDEDVAPWVGDRVGVVALPSGGEEPDVLAAVAHTDATAAREALTRAAEDEDLAFVVLDDYALIGDDQAVVDAAAEADEHLADDEGFTEAVDALEGDQVALAWADIARVWDALPAQVRDQAVTQEGLDPSGRVVVGVHALDDAVEVVGRTLDVSSGLADEPTVSAATGSGLAGRMPAKAVAALSLAGLGVAVEQGYDAFLEGLADLAPNLEAQAEELGLDLPEDLTTVLGDEAAVAAWGDLEAPEVLVRTRAADPAAARDVIADVLEATGSGQDADEVVRVLDDGVAAGTPGGLDAVDGATLSDRGEFTDAVPDAEGAAFVLWVSLQDALGLAGVDEPDAEPLEAVGVTVSGDDGADVRFRIRVTLR